MAAAAAADAGAAAAAAAAARPHRKRARGDPAPAAFVGGLPLPEEGAPDAVAVAVAPRTVPVPPRGGPPLRPTSAPLTAPRGGGCVRRRRPA